MRKEVANLPERNNPHTQVYGVKEYTFWKISAPLVARPVFVCPFYHVCLKNGDMGLLYLWDSFVTLELISLIPLVGPPHTDPLAVKILDNRLCIQMAREYEIWHTNFTSSELNWFHGIFINTNPSDTMKMWSSVIRYFLTLTDEDVKQCDRIVFSQRRQILLCQWHHYFDNTKYFFF